MSNKFQTDTEQSYLDMLKQIMEQGELVPNRTGISAWTMPHAMTTFDMSDGTLPLMTHKKMPIKSIGAELWCFLHGIRSKAKFKEMGTTIWNEWANPKMINSSLTGQARLDAMLAEDDLGPVYGAVWRNFGYRFDDYGDPLGTDQIAGIENALRTKEGRESRRLICSAWEPNLMSQQALPPCHFSWQLRVINDTLHLNYNIRSNDLFLGKPFNDASYGILLALFADTYGLKRGKMTAFISDAHVYENHAAAVREAVTRPLYPFPKISFKKKYNSVLEWHPSDTILENYVCGDRIHAPVAV